MPKRPREKRVSARVAKDILEIVHRGELAVAREKIEKATGCDLSTAVGRLRAVELLGWEGGGYTASPRLLMTRICWATNPGDSPKDVGHGGR